MANKRKTQKKKRVEPGFADKGGRGKGLRADPDDRPAARRRGKKTAAKKKAGSRSRTRSWFVAASRKMIYWGLVLGLWCGIGVAGLMAYYGAKMPSAETWAVPDRPPNVKILAADGSVLANRGATGGEALTLSRMSPYIPMAVVAIEDRRYYSHFGIDPIGLARALVRNLMAGRTVQGGSTLTQQLAKNLFLSPDRTLERKVQEVMLAVWLEHKFTKDQILEMYLNRVYFGSGAYGVEAASRRYFKKSARDVSLAQAAILAGVLKAPSRLSPARDPEAAEGRAQIVLEAMREQGFVSDREMATAMTAAPSRPRSYWSGSENYAADLVMEQLEDMIGGKVETDLVVDTTIDPGLQMQAESVIRDTIDGTGSKARVSQGAMISLDGTGAIRAIVGGHDYATSQFNRATTAKRQPGSAFKPFVYVTALEMGLMPESVRNDAPVRIGKWTPENYDGEYSGPVTLTEALTRSLNTVAAQIVMETGPGNVVKTAHRMGIESHLESNASIALGTSEVTLTELTSAFAPFMNGGYKATPHVIRRVSTSGGKVLYENTYDNPPRVLRSRILAMMNAMLGKVVDEGTGRKAGLGVRQAAGKTGTSQAFRDALFVGYTANLTTGVWFGNDDGTPTNKVTGGSLPAAAWKTFMVKAHEDLPVAPLPVYYSLEARGGEEVLSREVAPGRPGRGAAREGVFPGVSDDMTGSTVPGRLPPADIGESAPGRTTTLFDLLTGRGGN